MSASVPVSTVTVARIRATLAVVAVAIVLGIAMTATGSESLQTAGSVRDALDVGTVRAIGERSVSLVLVSSAIPDAIRERSAAIVVVLIGLVASFVVIQIVLRLLSG